MKPDSVVFVSVAAVLWAASAHAQATAIQVFPANNAKDVNPDTRLKITFPTAPPLGNMGKITIYDASNDSVVDTLDMSIPPGPKNTRTPAPYNTLMYASVPNTVYTVKTPDTDPTHVYQQNDVGGTASADAHHFFPVLINDKVATICPHNNHLAYNKTYYVQIDPTVFPVTDNSFTGVTGKTAWTFTTKAAAPSSSATHLIVAADGTGDFNTIQGLFDFVPANNPNMLDVFVKNGIYEEIVAFSAKQNVTLHGEDRDKVVIRYANNGVFNAGRAVFAEKASNSINLVNFTILSTGGDENPAQAEALYVQGDKDQVYDVTMWGSGDALQIQNGTRAYFSESSLRGYGDNILSYGAAFFNDCHLISTYGPHGWPRNPSTNHGDVFLNCTFSLDGVAAPPAGTGALGTSGDGHCDFARSPASGVSFPYAEFVVLNSKLEGLSAAGWGMAGPDYTNVHFWEYNSVNVSDGKPVDVSKRVSYSKQLTMASDATTIMNYSTPSYVLAGWTPQLAPVLLTQLPATTNGPVGGNVTFTGSVAANPAATYQWLKNGQPIPGQTGATLTLSTLTPADAGMYSVTIQNSVGMITSNTATLTVGGVGVQPGGSDAGAQGGAGGTSGTQVGTGGTTASKAGAGGTFGAQAGAANAGAANAGGNPPPANTSVGGSGALGAAGRAAGTSTASNGYGPSNSTGNGCGCRVGAARESRGGTGLALLAASILVARARRRACRRPVQNEGRAACR